MLDTAANHTLDRQQQDAGQHHGAAPTPSGSRPSGPRWHIIATHSQAERRATHNLSQQGYETYLPLVTVRRRDNAIRSLLHRVEVPLFPGYAFVRFDALRDPWRPITNTPGVYALLRSASTGLPHPCPDDVVNALRASEAVRATPTPDDPLWAPGMACRLAKGPFRWAASDAVVLAVNGAKATVALMLLGAMRDTTVPVAWLVKRNDA